MIVVDANVIVYSVIQSERTALAKQVASKDAQWIVPPLWRFEFTSALTTLIRGKALDMDIAIAAIDEADALCANREIAVAQRAALDTALHFDLSAYDAQYIVLAQRFRAWCVTADKKLLANAPQFAVSIEDAVHIL